MHILLIEDDLDLGRALQSALKVEGLTSEWLRRAVDAPATVDATTVDCVLLDLAALDEGQRPSPRDLDVAQWLRAALAQAAPQAMARQIALSLDAPDTLPARLDLPALESIVHNLIDNAARYHRAGGHVAVGLRQAGALLHLVVQDDGPGIPATERSRVFERFYRGAGHAAPGSGLGLAIVQQAVRRMGGQVQLGEGLDGQGVGFFVSIPLPRSA